MRIRTAHNLDNQGVRQLQIGNKLWLTRHQGNAIDLAQTFPNGCKILGSIRHRPHHPS